ncbi:MAG: endonuclease/exonuclease/phosphatase family protein [Saprospiraceae bacterium]
MRFILLLISLLTLTCHSGQLEDIKLMTYNIRYNNPGDGPNWWELRKGKVADLILKHSPDVLGVQEAVEGQMRQLDSFLLEYKYYGVGRDDGKTKGEYSAIFFKKEKFKSLDSGTFWLSETPEVIGSVGWDAAMERICSWVHLENNISKKSFFVFNAHFDHIGKEARKNSASLIIEKIKEIAGNAPVVFMGDLNFKPDDAPYPIILKNGFNDSFINKGETCTFTGFEVADAECRRIDYIFTNQIWAINSFLIDDENNGQYFPSDHSPVIVNAAF